MGTFKVVTYTGEVEFTQSGDPEYEEIIPIRDCKRRIFNDSSSMSIVFTANYNGTIYDYIVSLNCEYDGIWHGKYEYHSKVGNESRFIEKIILEEIDNKLTISCNWDEDTYRFTMVVRAETTSIKEFDESEL